MDRRRKDLAMSNQAPRLYGDSKYFTIAELQCAGTLKCAMDPKFMKALEKVREEYGKPMRVTSGYRSLEHNAKIGGAPNSQHLHGLAVDISCTDSFARFELIRLGMKHGLTGFGIAQTFLHMDMRPTTPVVYFYDEKGKYK